MPQKNSLKIYIENGCYHVYNRGVEKREIFLDEQDYKVFLHFLKQYLSPPSPQGTFLTLTGLHPVRPRSIQTLHDQVDLLAYCLMPNHFHFLLKQITFDGMTKLLRRVCTNYVMFFNKKYKRVGTLFQGIYKAISVDVDEYLLHLSRYIHLNPMLDRVAPCRGMKPPETPADYPFSSYQNYLGNITTSWVKPKEVLSFFKTARRTSLKDILSYQSFIEDYQEDPREMLGNLIIEE